jgi:UPF0755 protein
MKSWLVRAFAVLAFVGAVLAGSAYWFSVRINEPGPEFGQTTVVIPKGTPSQDIGQLLKEADVIDRPWLFLLAARLPRRQPLQAGEYSFPPHVSLAAVIDMMRHGQVVVHKFTVAEGLSVYQVLGQMRQAEGLTGNAGPLPEEGSLLPRTYFYSFGDTREALLFRMGRAMNETIDELWPKRATNLPLANKVEAIILASIVERETALADERPHVAAVFLNRLRQHMKLQSDPTVIYAISNGEGTIDRALTRDDLSVKSPYNTYVVDGLPAGPICNPGYASLNAVLHPADSNDLYFVADGSGGHVFARTLPDHNKNVVKWRAVQGKAEDNDKADRTKSAPPKKH